MDKYIYNEQNGLWYELQGDYYIPCLVLDEEDTQPIGMWGRKHLRYIKEHRPVLHTTLLLGGKLNSYLAEIDNRAAEMFERLMKEPWAGEVRGVLDTFDCREGEEILRIYSSATTRKAMLEELKKYVGAPRTVSFGISEEKCDVVIPDAGGGNMVKELKKRYEPVDIRGWRNIIRF